MVRILFSETSPVNDKHGRIQIHLKLLFDRIFSLLFVTVHKGVQMSIISE